MKQLMKLAAAAAVGALAAGSIAFAQGQAAPEPRAIVSLYHAAPGQQLNLLKWMAKQDEAAKAAGIAASQLYIHTDGDSWDYMTINPLTPASEAQRTNAPNGAKVSLELRQYIASHTDTYTVGPVTAADAVAAASGS